MANSVDPDQTAPIGAVCSRVTLFAPILNSMEADDFSRRHFQMHSLLGALRANLLCLMEFPPRSIGRIHFEFKGCWLVKSDSIHI